jgi:predicted Zn-dependent protease with MMP-like domain
MAARPDARRPDRPRADRPVVSVTARAAAALVALVAGLGAVAFWAPVPGPIQIAAGALLGTVLLAALTVGLGGPRAQSEEEFDAVVERAERLAHGGEVAAGDDFDALVREALDDLPPEFRRALETVAVTVSDDGWRRRAYGLYHGDGVARDDVPDRIVVYRDTLVRDFGHAPELLRAQITRTVRHELAHHLGWDEPGVRGLGL